MWLLRASIMPAWRNAKGRQKWCEEFVESHAFVYLPCWLLLVVVWRWIWWEREVGFQDSACMHPMWDVLLQFRSGPCTCCSLVFPTPPTHQSPDTSKISLFHRSNQRKMFQAMQYSNNHTSSENRRSGTQAQGASGGPVHCLGFEFC